MRAPILFILLLIPACTLTGASILNIPQENTTEPITAHFCEQENCEQILANLIQNSQTIDCAFYSLNSELLKTTLTEKNARVIIEWDNRKDVAGIKQLHTDTRREIMHNKFCIFDNTKVFTGSFNPTSKNTAANNLLIIPSQFIAQNYKAEFEELWRGTFGKGKKVLIPQTKINGALVENYFCPEDNCQKHVLTALNNAQQSIHFMTYSFTDETIGNLLLKKSKKISVTGIFDSSQLNAWTQYKKLKSLSNVKKGIHHKVFIIDENIVITGSYNPTRNGNENNDENIVIIHDKNIAQQFLTEFNLLAT